MQDLLDPPKVFAVRVVVQGLGLGSLDSGFQGLGIRVGVLRVRVVLREWGWGSGLN